MGELIKEHRHLMFDLSWDVLWHGTFNHSGKRHFYQKLLNRYPNRFLTGTDFVAASYKNLTQYDTELKHTSLILHNLNDEAFRRIGLGQNFFDILGLNFQAPPICRQRLR